jgi:hypothetical protein
LPRSPSAARQRSRPQWTSDRIVTFCVTLAATRNVTLAARATGMSRKSAYARRTSDPGFAALWDRALAAARAARSDTARARHSASRQGDKHEVDETHMRHRQKGDSGDLDRLLAETERDRFFAGLQMRRAAAFRDQRLGRPLANDSNPSNGDRFDPRGSANPRLARP